VNGFGWVLTQQADDGKHGDEKKTEDMAADGRHDDVTFDNQ